MRMNFPAALWPPLAALLAAIAVIAVVFQQLQSRDKADLRARLSRACELALQEGLDDRGELYRTVCR